MKLGNDSTLGEEAQLDKHFQARLETASVDSPTAQLAELTETQYLKTKDLLFEMGFKKDIILLEQAMRKSQMLKNSMRI